MKEIEINEVKSMLMAQGMEESEAQTLAVMNVELVERMKEGSVRFSFKKSDGSVREAEGTLEEAVIMPHITGTGTRPANPSLTTYWDNEADGWRCFKKANLVSVNAQ